MILVVISEVAEVTSCIVPATIILVVRSGVAVAIELTDAAALIFVVRSEVSNVTVCIDTSTVIFVVRAEVANTLTERISDRRTVPEFNCARIAVELIEFNSMLVVNPMVEGRIIEIHCTELSAVIDVWRLAEAVDPQITLASRYMLTCWPLSENGLALKG